MDETDIGTATGPEALSAEAARQWAEQQRAAARAQFDTPTWLGPARMDSAAYIPPQPEADHDEIPEEPLAPVVRTNRIPDTAHWSEKAAPRVLAGTVLFASLAGVIGFLVVAILSQSVVAIAGLAACAIVAVIFRGALMGTGVTTVDLKGSVMRVRKRGVLDVVNLADPVHAIELVGTPGQSAWRLRLEAIDGRIIELGPNEVDATQVHEIVEYYRAVAERAKLDRERRFNR
jgi:hypothetical protein